MIDDAYLDELSRIWFLNTDSQELFYLNTANVIS